MRDLDTIFKALTGDTTAAQDLISYARTQSGILKNQMRLGGLSVGTRTSRLADGTVVHVTVAAGQTRVAIYAPPGAPPARNPYVREPAVAAPRAPELLSEYYQIVIVLGLSTGNSSSEVVMYPFQYGSSTFTQPKAPGGILAMVPHDVYRFEQKPHNFSSPPIDGVWLGIGVVDQSGALTSNHVDIACATNHGATIQVLKTINISPSPLPALMPVKAFNDAYPDQDLAPHTMWALGLNPAWVDTQLNFTAGGLANAFTLEGGAQIWVNNNNLGSSSGMQFTVNGAPAQFLNASVVPAAPIAIQLSAVHAASMGSYIWGVGFSIAYPTSILSNWGFLTGRIFNPVGAVTSSSGVTTTSISTNSGTISFDYSFPASPGNYSMSGTITCGDGYGTTKTIPFTFSVTVTAP